LPIPLCSRNFVVDPLPLGQSPHDFVRCLHTEVVALVIDLERVELHEIGLLWALDLAIEMGSTDAVRSPLDLVFVRHVEELMAEELAAPVALDQLDREREAREHPLLEEVSR